MLKFYKEANDYLVIDTKTNDYYLKSGEDCFEGRHVQWVNGGPESVTTGAIHMDYLKAFCKRVPKVRIPKKWLKVLI